MSNFTTIAIDAMEGVTGGKGKPAVSTGISGGTTSTTDNSALLAGIQGIQSSLASIGKNNNGCGLNTTTAMCMGLALASRRQSEVRVYGRGGGYYYQSSWG